MNKKMTTEEFIARAKEVHGDKYDYSKVKYVNSKTPVCIICPEHGEFLQAPIIHLKPCDCPECAKDKRNKKNSLTTEEFIKRAREVHGDKFDYSLATYVNAKTYVDVICHEKDEFGEEHGVFRVKPFNHLKGYNCPKCSKSKPMDKERFIKLATLKHNNKYDYSKIEYVNNATRVCIICPEHGEFWQTPNDHLHGHGCRKCYQPNANITQNEFLELAHKKFGSKFDYSQFVYRGYDKKGIIICPEHGPFEQTPRGHLQQSKCGCPKCSGSYKKTTEDFIQKAREVHGDKYDYSKVEYVDAHTKVCIICPEHGEFLQPPHSHLKGCGCPNCAGIRKECKFNLLEEFKDEYKFRAFLETNDINILYVLLMNVVESKFDPIKKDIEKALANASEVDPIQALEDKYKSDNDEEDENEIENTKTTIDLNDIDWDDEEAVNTAINAKITAEDKEDKQPTIEDLIRNTEQEIKVINRVEHMLTPEVREYIMKKFLNDKRRLWMAERGK